ncbi:uncharacterized protein LOC135821512 [Sycon ciliatum]|uniref:uncharacterized protein LOC135821512 n=1 Tax=Sycon ciliatum TaxID=27933 RepID=UPI0031F70A2B
MGAYRRSMVCAEWHRIALLLVLLAMAIAVDETVGQTCEKVDQCSCRLSDTGEVVSLKALDGNKRLKNGIIGINGYTYHFNPCTSELNLGPECSPTLDSAACQEAGANDVYSLGKTSSVNFDVIATNPSQIVFTYNNGTPNGDNIRQLKLNVRCDMSKDDDLIFDAEEENWQWRLLTSYMILNSKWGCPGYKEPSTSSGLYGGSVMLIILFVLVPVYLAAGVAYGVAQHKTGVELIPNFSFWSSLPDLIKGGFTWVTTCGKKGGGGDAKSRGDYEKL